MKTPTVASQLSSFLLLATILMFNMSQAHAEFTGGTGRANDPYAIATAEELISIGSDPNLLDKHFILVADIDLDPNLPNGRVFTQAVIAPATGDPNNPERQFFIGTFDGGGHTIKNLTIHANGVEWLGLFGEIAEGGRVSNVAIDGITIQGGERVGALAGWNTGTVDHCSSTGNISGDWFVGGLVGQNGGRISHSHSTVCVQGGDDSSNLGGLVGMLFWDGSISDCHSAGRVSAGQKSYWIGGLVGNYDSLGGTITNCWTTADVTSGQESSSVGGLVGDVMMGGAIRQCYASSSVVCGDRSKRVGGLVGSFSGFAPVTDCYATGSVTGGTYTWPLGGLIGSLTSFSVTITHCYATGRVFSEGVKRGLGGLIGEITDLDFGGITGCFWDVETSGVSVSAAGEGLTTAQMQSIQPYQAAGWDFVGDRTDGTADTWVLPSGGGYPQLTVFSSGYSRHTLAGAGSPQGPFLVETAEDLSAISEQNAACYRLGADIDLAEITWRRACIPEFTGTFDGGGHRIRHLTIRSTETGTVGFFGNMKGQVWNLGLEDVSITAAGGSTCVGGLAGSSSGYITSCYVTGSISTGGKSRSIGGLVGDCWLSTIADCYAATSVSSGDGSSNIGGLAGDCYETTIIHAYAAGTASAGKSEGVGGLVGAAAGGSVTGCFWDSETSRSSDGHAGTGLPTSQMTDVRTYLDAGWDFVGEIRNGPADIWQMPEDGGYPVLMAFCEDRPSHMLAGAGTLDDPYLIEDARDLGTISRYNPLACYKLTGDLDLSDIVWTAAPITDFNGVFDGNGHTISNLSIHSAYFSALFGYLGAHAVVKNLAIRDANVIASGEAWCAGILAGRSNGNITGCHVTGRLSAGDESRAIGGIVGQVDEGMVVECDAACDISVGQKGYQVGGIAGFSLAAQIARCHATANVLGDGGNACMGGLVGEAHFWTVICDCYADGCISTSRSKGLGGLVGVVSEGDLFPTFGKIANCYAAGRIVAGEDSSYVGGLLGIEAEVQPLTSQCYFLTSPQSPDNGNGTPLSDEQMMQQTSFVNWDFDSIWTITEGVSRPHLRWERGASEP